MNYRRNLEQFIETRAMHAKIWLSLSDVPQALISGDQPLYAHEVHGLTPMDAHMLAEFVIYELALTVVRTSGTVDHIIPSIFVELQGLVEGLSKVHHTVPFMTWFQHARVDCAESLVKFLNYYRRSHAQSN